MYSRDRNSCGIVVCCWNFKHCPMCTATDSWKAVLRLNILGYVPFSIPQSDCNITIQFRALFSDYNYFVYYSFVWQDENSTFIDLEPKRVQLLVSLYSKPCRIGRDNAFISTTNCLYYYYLTDQKIYRLIGESFQLVLFGQLKGLVWILKPSWRNSGRVSACTVIKTYARINEFCALTFAPFYFKKCLIYTVGEFGRYQWIQYLLHLLPAFTGGVFYQTFKEEIVFERLPKIISLLAWKQLKTCEYFFLYPFLF
jgi:hypothetical protein